MPKPLAIPIGVAVALFCVVGLSVGFMALNYRPGYTLVLFNETPDEIFEGENARDAYGSTRWETIPIPPLGWRSRIAFYRWRNRPSGKYTMMISVPGKGRAYKVFSHEDLVEIESHSIPVILRRYGHKYQIELGRPLSTRSSQAGPAPSG